MIDTNNISSLMGATVLDSSGDKVGTVGQVYVDPADGHALWASVRTGLFGTRESFVPLETATWSGDTLSVNYEKSFVKDAPRIDADEALSSEDEDALYSYYSLDSGVSTGTDYVDTTRSTGTDHGTVGHDTSGPNTDDAMTRSEERLNVGTQKVQTGSARLRKYIVSEQQTVTVPVTHEEVHLEREPITDANIGKATRGADLTSEEHEVALTEERVVVDKETVPVERVRLDKDTVTENQQVTEEVRKEQIELDGDVNNHGDVSNRDRDVRK